jgi:hypothetical protein
VFPLENVTVAQGRDATFTCVVNNLGGYRVSPGSTGDATAARVCIGIAKSLITLKDHRKKNSQFF